MRIECDWFCFSTKVRWRYEKSFPRPSYSARPTCSARRTDSRSTTLAGVSLSTSALNQHQGPFIKSDFGSTKISRLFTIPFFSISFLTWPTELKLCRMILDIGAQARSVPGFAISSQGALRGACLLKSSNRFTAYSIHAIELKLDRRILDISSLRWKPDFSIAFQKVLWGARLLKSSNQFTAHNSYAIELKLSRMLLDISPYNRFQSDSPVFSQGCCWGAS